MSRALRPVGFSLVAALWLCACGQSDPSSPEYWIEKLDGPERRSAVRRLGELKSPKAVDPLLEIFKDGRHRDDIVAALAQIGDKRAVPALVEALQDGSDPDAARVAASTLLDWGVKEHLDVYLNVATNPKAPKEARYGALQLVAAFPDERVIQPLLPVLEGDPDIQPIVYNGLAAEALGKVRAKKAVDGLIACLWLDDHLGRNEVANCRLALNRIGPDAVVPRLIETLQRKNRKVEARARKFQYDKGGLIEAKVAELLGDMPRPEAVEPLLAALKHEDEMPPNVQNDPKKAQQFVMAGVQKVISIANALAVIGDERAVEPLLEIAGGKEYALEHKLAAVQQLAFLGSQKAVPGLFELLDDEPHPRDPVSQGFRVQIALNLANLVAGDDAKTVERLEKTIQGIKEKMQGWAADLEKEMKAAPADKKGGFQRDLQAFAEWQREYDKVLAKVAALKECTNNPVCWGKKLDAKNDQAVRMLAAYRLAQMGEARDTALKQLVPHIGDEDLVFRNVVLFALDRLGDHSIIDDLKKARAADEDRAKKDKAFKNAVYTIDLMIAKLSHRPKR